MAHRRWSPSALLACLPASAPAQYFGRNKVQYRTFDFQILQDRALRPLLLPGGNRGRGDRVAHGRALVRAAVAILRPRAARPAAVILYAVGRAFPPDERHRRTDRRRHRRRHRGAQAPHRAADVGLARRHRSRARPRAGPRVPVRHHGRRSARRRRARRRASCEFPLWFVEGMAEYLSLGPVDAQTAMWMRDAALREKLPDIKDLDDPKYFPYRWGHAFWAYIGAKYGDRAVASLIRSAANPRFDLDGPGAPARHRSRRADRGLAPRDPRIGGNGGRRRCRRCRVEPRLLIEQGSRRRALQHRPRAQSRRHAGRVLLRARRVFDRPVPRRRRDAARSPHACRSRRPIRTSTAWSS